MKQKLYFNPYVFYFLIGGTSYVLVKPRDATELGDLYRLELLTLEGDTVADIPLQRLPGNEPIFNGTTFTAPFTPFHVKVNIYLLYINKD